MPEVLAPKSPAEALARLHNLIDDESEALVAERRSADIDEPLTERELTNRFASRCLRLTSALARIHAMANGF